MSVTIIIRPSSYADTSTSYATATNLANAYDANTSTYATFTAPAQSGAPTSYALTYYVFNLSSIPQDAEVTGITLKAKASATNINSTNKREFRLGLYDGTTAITGNKIDVTSSTASVLTSTFTSAEISSFLTSSSPRVRARAYTGRKTAASSTVTAYLYDLYLEITYEPSSGVKNKVKVNGSWVEAEPYVKVNGTWEKATNAFVKVNGNWEEVT